MGSGHQNFQHYSVECMNSTFPIILKSIGVFMISNKSKWKCNSGWYVHLYSFVYTAQQQGGYHPPFKLRGKLVLLLLLLGFEIFYQKPCRWFDPLFQCVCILKKISLLISSLAAKNHTPSPHKPKSHPLARDWELAHLCIPLWTMYTVQTLAGNDT